MTNRALLALVLCSLLFGVRTVSARQGDARLEPLFEQLAGADSVQQAETMVREIWGIWYESGDADINDLMARGMVAMNAGRFDVARRFFDEVIEADPDFAEGWNKRATVHWLMDNLEESMDDIQRTLALEPRHFGAASGMGLIFMQRGDKDGALRAFQQVLKINPSDTGAIRRVEKLQRLVDEEAV
jgi:tetratricopeptide (TPR) repeat protein